MQLTGVVYDPVDHHIIVHAVVAAVIRVVRAFMEGGGLIIIGNGNTIERSDIGGVFAVLDGQFTSRININRQRLGNGDESVGGDIAGDNNFGKSLNVGGRVQLVEGGDPQLAGSPIRGFHDRPAFQTSAVRQGDDGPGAQIQSLELERLTLGKRHLTFRDDGHIPIVCTGQRILGGFCAAVQLPVVSAAVRQFEEEEHLVSGQPVIVFVALFINRLIVELPHSGGADQTGVFRDAEGMFAGNQNLRGGLDCG